MFNYFENQQGPVKPEKLSDDELVLTSTLPESIPLHVKIETENLHSQSEEEIPEAPERIPVNAEIEAKNNRFYSDMKGRFNEFANREKEFSKKSRELAETLRQCDTSSLSSSEKALFLKSIESYEEIAKEADHFPEINEETLSTLESMMDIFVKIDNKLNTPKSNKAFKARASACMWSLLHLEALMPLYQKLLMMHPKKVEILLLLPTPFQNTLRLQLFSSEFLKSISKQFDDKSMAHFKHQRQSLQNLDDKSKLVASVANLLTEKLSLLKKEEETNRVLRADGKINPPILHEDVLEKMKETLILSVVSAVLEENKNPQAFEILIQNKIDWARTQSAYPRKTSDVFYHHLMEYYFPSIETDREEELKALIDKIKLIKAGDGPEVIKFNAMKEAICGKYNEMATSWRIKTVRGSRLCKYLFSLTETIKDYKVGSGYSFYYLNVQPTQDNYPALFTEYFVQNSQEYTLLDYALFENQLYEIDKEKGSCVLVATFLKSDCEKLLTSLNVKEKAFYNNRSTYRMIEKLSETQLECINKAVVDSKKSNQSQHSIFLMNELSGKLALRNKKAEESHSSTITIEPK